MTDTIFRILHDVGFIRWPLLFSLLAVVALAAWATLHLATGPRGRPETKAWIDSVLFWGGFAFLSGVLGTLVGIIQAAQAIELAGGEVPAALAWGGVKIALASTVIGGLILAFAGLAWFVLQLGWRLGGEDGVEGALA